MAEIKKYIEQLGLDVALACRRIRTVAEKFPSYKTPAESEQVELYELAHESVIELVAEIEFVGDRIGDVVRTLKGEKPTPEFLATITAPLQAEIRRQREHVDKLWAYFTPEQQKEFLELQDKAEREQTPEVAIF